MSETVPRDIWSLDDETARMQPVVGLIATDQNAASVTNTILRARENGHQTIVTSLNGDCEALHFARLLGSLVIEPADDWNERHTVRARLRQAARAGGYPGLILPDDPSDRIDFTASSKALATGDEFVVDARTESTVTQSPAVLVGIPAYNEATAIASVVEAALRYADEVLVVDDGSDDATARRAKEAGASVVTHETNDGYGAALKTIFTEAEKCRTDHLVILDGDGQHDPADIERLVEKQRQTGAEVVIGSRFGEESNTEMPLYRRFGLGVINILTNLSIGRIRPTSRVQDTQSGFRAYDRTAISTLSADENIGDHMHASTDILYHANERGYGIEKITTTIDYDVEGASSHNPFHHGLILVTNILRRVERERPITILSLPGALCTFSGIVVAYNLLSSFVQSGSYSVVLAVVAPILVVIGLFLSITGIVLHSLSVHSGQ